MSSDSKRVGRRRLGKAPASGGLEGGISGSGDQQSLREEPEEEFADDPKMLLKSKPNPKKTSKQSAAVRAQGSSHQAPVFSSLPANWSAEQQAVLLNLPVIRGIFHPQGGDSYQILKVPELDQEQQDIPGRGDVSQMEKHLGGIIPCNPQQVNHVNLRFPKVDAGQLRSMSGVGNNRMMASANPTAGGGSMDGPVPASSSLHHTGSHILYASVMEPEICQQRLDVIREAQMRLNVLQQKNLESDQMRQMMKEAQERLEYRGDVNVGSEPNALPEQLKLQQKTGLQLRPSPQGVMLKEEAYEAAPEELRQSLADSCQGAGEVRIASQPPSFEIQSMDWNPPSSLEDLMRHDLSFEMRASAGSLGHALWGMDEPPSGQPPGSQESWMPNWLQVSLLKLKLCQKTSEI